MRFALVLAVAFWNSGVACAQEAEIPPMACEKPKIPERVSVAPEDLKYLSDKTSAYRECVVSYIGDRRKQSDKLQAMAEAEIEAGNDAARDLNGVITQVQVIMDKNKPDPDEQGLSQ